MNDTPQFGCRNCICTGALAHFMSMMMRRSVIWKMDTGLGVK